MPFEFTHVELSSGPYLRIDAAGYVGLTDGEALARALEAVHGGSPKMMIRLTKPIKGPTRMFTDEAEAVAWLDEQAFVQRSEH